MAKNTTLNKVVKEHYHGDFGEAVRAARRIEEDLKFEQAKKLLRENGNKVPYHRWYRHEQYNYAAYGTLKGKITGYMKSWSVGRGGQRRGWVYYRTYETGVMVYIDEQMGKIGIRQGMTSPANFQSATKKEFNDCYKRFMKMIN